MRTFVAGAEDAGVRLDRYLRTILRAADPPFLHRMLRKKNIVVNDQKQEGAYRLREGDTVSIFFSEETFLKFTGSDAADADACARFSEAYRVLSGDHGVPPRVLYEDSSALIVFKPAGVLSQRVSGKELSVNEWIPGYLLHTKQADAGSLGQYRPSVCNRLDKGTGGLILAAKTRSAARTYATLLREGQITRIYLACVTGIVRQDGAAYGNIVKDRRQNRVTITGARAEDGREMRETERLRYHVLAVNEGEALTLLAVTLLDGKSHQIRAQLAHTGHPVIGDRKYGDPARNALFKEQDGVCAQLLHAYALSFPEGDLCGALSGKTVTSPLPEQYKHFLKRHRLPLPEEGKRLASAVARGG